MKRLLLALALATSFACGPKLPNLDPTNQRLWQTKEAIMAIGTVQDVALKLNGIESCDPLPCKPLLSDDATEIVVDAVADGTNVLRTIPNGTRGIAYGVLDVITKRLQPVEMAHLKFYLDAARSAITEFVPQ